MVLQEKDIAAGDRQGIDRIVAKYRQKFRVAENLDHYSEADFHESRTPVSPFLPDKRSMLIPNALA